MNCFILLLSGDVHLNPGPVLYPCRICCKSVQNNQRGLLCDMCHRWCHIKCVSVSDIEHDNYCELGEFNWLCPICLFNQLPSLEVIDDVVDSCGSADISCSSDLPCLMDIIDSPVDGVRFVHHNVRGLLSKFSEVSEWLFKARNSPLILCCSETWITVNDLIPNVAGFNLIHFAHPCCLGLISLRVFYLVPVSLYLHYCNQSVLLFVMLLKGHALLSTFLVVLLLVNTIELQYFQFIDLHQFPVAMLSLN